MNMTTFIVRHVVICFESEAGIPATPGTVSDLERTMCVWFLNLKLSIIFSDYFSLRK